MKQAFPLLNTHPDTYALCGQKASKERAATWGGEGSFHCACSCQTAAGVRLSAQPLFPQILCYLLFYPEYDVQMCIFSQRDSTLLTCVLRKTTVQLPPLLSIVFAFMALSVLSLPSGLTLLHQWMKFHPFLSCL